MAATDQADVLWRVPVSLQGRYWSVELAVPSGPDGTAAAAKGVAEALLSHLCFELGVPAAWFIVGEPYQATMSPGRDAHV